MPEAADAGFKVKFVVKVYDPRRQHGERMVASSKAAIPRDRVYEAVKGFSALIPKSFADELRELCKVRDPAARTPLIRSILETSASPPPRARRPAPQAKQREDAASAANALKKLKKQKTPKTGAKKAT